MSTDERRFSLVSRRLVGGDPSRPSPRCSRPPPTSESVPVLVAAALLSRRHHVPHPRRDHGRAARPRPPARGARRRTAAPARSTCSTRSCATTSPTTPTTCWRPGSPAGPPPIEHHEKEHADVHLHHRPSRRRSADHRAHDRPLDDLVRGLPSRRLRRHDPHRPGRQPRLGARRWPGHRRGAGRRPGLGAPRPRRRLDGRLDRSHGPGARCRPRRRRGGRRRTAPPWATWSSRAPSAVPPSGSRRPRSCGAGSALSRWRGRRTSPSSGPLGWVDHHLVRHRGRRAVHRLRLLRCRRGRRCSPRSCRCVARTAERRVR